LTFDLNAKNKYISKNIVSIMSLSRNILSTIRVESTKKKQTKMTAKILRIGGKQ